jgi:hypothetical protein
MRRFVLLVTAFVLVAPSANAQLKIEGIEAVYGALGPARPSAEYCPQDQAVFRFRISGARVDPQGAFDGDMIVAVTDPAGQVERSTSRIGGVLAFGGGTLAGVAHLDLPTDTRPGQYVLAVTVRDRRANSEAGFERKVTVKPAAFAVVAPRSYFDAAHKVPAPFGGIVGQTLYLDFKVIGFARDRLDVTMDLQVADADGKDLLPEPIRARVAVDDAERAKDIPFVRFKSDLALNRVGQYTVRVVVRDRVKGGMARFEAPLKIAAAP